MVQKIQKIYEMKEFLFSVKNEGILKREENISNALKQIHNWIYRTPNSAFDKLIIWDDILVSRNLYLDLYNHRL